MILAPADEGRDGSSIPETPFATLRGRSHCPATDAQRLVLFRYRWKNPKVASVQGLPPGNRGESYHRIGRRLNQGLTNSSR